MVSKIKDIIRLKGTPTDRISGVLTWDPPASSAKDTQVGGSHYTKYAIQPYEYIRANNIEMIEGNVIKYVTRWKDKGGVEDLKKAIHCLQWLIEWEEKNE